MVQIKCRLWNISISILIFLTLYNIFLTIKLMYSSSSSSSTSSITCKQNDEILVKNAIPTTIQFDCSFSNNGANENSNKEHQQPISTSSPNNPYRNDYTNFNKNSSILNMNYFTKTNEKYSINMNLNLGRSDNQLLYKLYDNVIVGDNYTQLSQQYKTCLATQSSLDKIESIIESSYYWGGPISLAVFAPTEKELNHLLHYILFLRKCYLKIREKVTFHFAILKEKGPKNYTIDINKLDKMDCGNPMGTLHDLLVDIISIREYMAPWRHKLAYPQNHLRNLARKNCQTPYVFLTDIDIIPSRGMADYLNDFLTDRKCSGKCAYVVPTYELDERVMFPPNKTDLIRLANKGLARPFHHRVFIYNQFATNFSKWQNYTDPDYKISISHPVTNFEFLYEPFYIATDIVPPHDERFVGYGYTRNTQVYEMYVAGYEFFVLSPVFTCHWGIQMKKSRPPWREHQNSLNRKHFDKFKKEIFARYNKDPLNMMSQKKT